jgi:hypothetical protein
VELLFLDDSVQQGRRSGLGQVVAVGGVFVREERLQPLERKIDDICEAHGLPAKSEVKWSPPPTNWIHDHLVEKKREECYREILQAAAEHEVRAVVAVLDLGRKPMSITTAVHQDLTFVFERATIYLQNEKRLGLIIADKPGGGKKQEEEVLDVVLETIQAGTDFVPPTQIPINVMTTHSRLVRSLQLADLIVGITTAMVAGAERYAAPLFPIIRPMFLRHQYKWTIGGTGLKIHPRSMTNLYHWVLGENTYWRLEPYVGWKDLPLPDPAFPYAENDGLEHMV